MMLAGVSVLQLRNGAAPKRIPVLLAVVLLALALALPASAFIGGTGSKHPKDSPGPPLSCGGGAGNGGGGDPCGSPVHVVNPFTGDLVIWDIPVYYDSVGAVPPFYISYSAQTGDSGPLGDRWTHSFNSRIIEDGSEGVWVIYGNGNRYYFPSDGEDGFESPVGVFDTLEWDEQVLRYVIGINDDSCACPPGDAHRASVTGITLRVPPRPPIHSRQTFLESGRLLRFKDANGLNYSLQHNQDGLLTSITDPASRTTTFD
jgi:YD repeat-containing protein